MLGDMTIHRDFSIVYLYANISQDCLNTIEQQRNMDKKKERDMWDTPFVPFCTIHVIQYPIIS